MLPSSQQRICFDKEMRKKNLSHCFFFLLLGFFICSFKVSTKRIIGSKTGGKADEKELFCNLENRLHQETTYETNRLACLLMVNGDPLWHTLTLSKPMIFSSKHRRFVFSCVARSSFRVVLQR